MFQAFFLGHMIHVNNYGAAEASKSPIQESHTTSACVDSPLGWYDIDGPTYNCKWYGSEFNRCQSYGCGYRNFGKTANEACCVCGGGEYLSPTTPPTPDPTPSPSQMPSASPSSTPTLIPCEDSLVGWHDSEGPYYNCNYYGQKDHCVHYGDLYRNMNMTANEVCCVCGGGFKPSESPSVLPTMSPSSTPSVLPTISPSSIPTLTPCEDSPIGWHDSDGPAYDCSFYEQRNNCEHYGDLYRNMNKTANEACCVCGGGIVQLPPTVSPTMLPSNNNTSNHTNTTCVDSPVGWFDSYGPHFNCSWYATYNACASEGDLYRNMNKTANEACCVCGGGINVTSTISYFQFPSLTSVVEYFVSFWQ